MTPEREDGWSFQLPLDERLRLPCGICGLQQQVAALRAFANEMLEYQHGSADGCDIQESAVKHGLLEIHSVTEPCGEDCGCEEFGFPLECYRKTALVSARAAAGEEGKS